MLQRAVRGPNLTLIRLATISISCCTVPSTYHPASASLTENQERGEARLFVLHRPKLNRPLLGNPLA